ncbi:MAG: hypothetical protein QF568_01695 [Flavobacteriales bacterium]|jgi:hypothetical protein|nr:hypothetical protein [Flavobacteriales bacterium]|tara:strand:- start:7 stop:393 length:387 start_codon:yes stop_codon:yes gene_type:complete
MSYLQRLKERYHVGKVTNLIKKGNFEDALKHIIGIRSVEKQKQIGYLHLGWYALDSLATQQQREFDVVFTEDRDDYERWKLLSGSSDPVKRLIYLNPQTGMIEAGLEEIINEVIPSDNPVLKYLRETK